MKAYAGVGAFVVLGTLLSTAAFAERKYSDWGPAVNLGCGIINSRSNDFGPGISKDGLSLYFSSNRGASDPNNADIYIAQRPSTSDPWGPPQNIGSTINTPATESNPSFSRDGHWMFFNSNRSPGGFGDVDLWASYRAHVHDDFAWETPFNLGPGVNTAGFEAGASYFENEDGSAPLLFFGRGLSATTQATTTDIWVADLLADGTFGNARPVPELNSPVGDQRPSIRFDGLEIFFFSTRAGSNDIWVATRSGVNDPWDPPERLTNVGTPVNTPFGEFTPHISADGLTLYFGSSRPALDAQGNPVPGCGGFDLYMSTRTQLKGKSGQD